MLKITNSLGGKCEEFVPYEKNAVRMYVCGVTPYDHAHLGHGRCYVTFDVLYRLLRFLGYDVTYCRNFTDIDDKLINRAHKELGDRLAYKQIADTYINSYHADMQALNCLAPTHEPRVTENMPAIINFIKTLVDKGYAYVADGDVYFHIAAFPNYAQLSKHDLADLRAGARVEVNDLKKDPLDFALWKSEPEGTFWQSPWGWGRPGWHIECSALADTYLGNPLDIHGGGMDLMFPHHENEIAQSEAYHNAPFVRYWMHNAFVNVDKEKMSKSLGNFFTLRDLFTHADPMVVRFYLLSHQYRAPLDFSLDELVSVQKAYEKIVRALGSASCQKMSNEEIKKFPTVQRMLAFLLDDLNTVGAIGVLFESLNKLAGDELCAMKQFVQEVFGLTLTPLPEKRVEITAEIQHLIEEREKARAAKDWARADALRDKLKSLGVDLQDKKLR